MTTNIANDLLALKRWTKFNSAQQLALDMGILENESNYIISAPTSSGKTTIAELAMLKALRSDQNVVYLVPLKALIADKENDFAYLEKDYKIAGVSSKIQDWTASNIVITTFEVFYRHVLRNPSILDYFGLAVVDEFHLLYDKLRGFNLEKVLTLLKDAQMRIVCLSATFEDKNEIGGWLDAEVVDVPDTARKIPIQHRLIDLSESQNPYAKLFKFLNEDSFEPCLLFCTTKAYTRARALQMTKLLKDNGKSQEFSEKIKKIVNREILTSIENDLVKCIAHRVGFYRSDLNSDLKDFIADLYVKRELDYLFTTTSLAYGVNFPARSVVLCDLSFFNPNVASKRECVPRYLYIQMAGRAGRQGLASDAYSLVVATNTNERDNLAEYILKGKLEKAKSHISYDSYFRKALLELIYAKRNTTEQILQFFEKTFYNYQSSEVKESFIEFNLFDVIKSHVVYLYNQGLVISMGSSGYELTDFGKVVVEFLFWSFSPYEIEPFVELKKLLDKDKKVKPSFNLLYRISQLFEGARLSKLRGQKSEIVNFYKKSGINRCSHPEYSAYAVYAGWMQNRVESEIEVDYHVNASQLSQVTLELFRLLEVYEKLGKKMNYEIDPEFAEFKERVKKGVKSDELPFVNITRIGRESVRELSKYVDNVFRGTNWKLKGTLLEVLKQVHRREGDERFKKIHMTFIKNIGEIRAQSILDLVKKSQETI